MEFTQQDLSPARLTHIEQMIWRDSYCIIPDVLTPDQADHLRSSVNDLREQELPLYDEPPMMQRVAQIAVKHQDLLAVMCHPLVLAFWRHMLGKDMVCSTWTSNTLLPGFNGGAWHVDYPYWSVQPPFPQDLFAGQSIWLLDDFTEGNGATGVVVGAHKTLAKPELERNAWPEQAKALTGRKGSLVLAHGAWWHCARPNTTTAPRTGLLGMYIRKFCLTQEDMRAQLAMLTDPSPELQALMCGQQHVPKMVNANLSQT